MVRNPGCYDLSLLGHHCWALLQPDLMTYQHPVHQWPFWVCNLLVLSFAPTSAGCRVMHNFPVVYSSQYACTVFFLTCTLSNSTPIPGLLLLWHNGLVLVSRMPHPVLSTWSSMWSPVSSSSDDLSALCVSMSFPSGSLQELSSAATSAGCKGEQILFVFSVSDICHLEFDNDSPMNINFLPHILYFWCLWCLGDWLGICPIYFFLICHLE